MCSTNIIENKKKNKKTYIKWGYKEANIPKEKYIYRKYPKQKARF